jgi:hypothetical protein
MKKPLLALLAAAGVSSAAFAQDFNYAKGDVLAGFRYTDTSLGEKSYIVNLGPRTALVNRSPINWAGINLSSDLIMVFGDNWNTTTTWGMLSIPSDKKTWAASSAVATGSSPISPVNVSYLGEPTTALDNIGFQFNSMSFETGNAATPGKLSQGIWGNSDDIGWVSAVFADSFAVGNFQAETSSDLDFYIAYGDEFGSAGNALRGETVDANTFSVQGGTFKSVPEPSTYALFGFAALLLIVAYRRANA